MERERERKREKKRKKFNIAYFIINIFLLVLLERNPLHKKKNNLAQYTNDVLLSASILKIL